MLGVCGPVFKRLAGRGHGWRRKTFPSLLIGCTIHSRVSEHRGHCPEVIIIQNHAVAELDAGATWGRSQVLEGDGRRDDNLKRGWFGRDRGDKGREGQEPSLDLAESLGLGNRCYRIFTPGSAAPLPGAWLQPLRAPGSLRLRLIQASEPRPPPSILNPSHGPHRNMFPQQRISIPWRRSHLQNDLWLSPLPTPFKALRS